MPGEPNERLIAVRLGAGLTQDQLADLGNYEVERATGRIGAMDGDYISKLERGIHTWPNKRYRQALCKVLGASDDRDLGFFCTRGRRATVNSDQPGMSRRNDDVRRADFLRLTGAAAASLATPNVFKGDAVRIATERQCAEWLAWELWQRRVSAIHVSELPLSIARYLGALDETGQINVGQKSMSPEGFIVGDQGGYFSFTQTSFVDFFVGQRIFGSLLNGKRQLLASAQTTHATDLVIQTFVQRHDPSVDLLTGWMQRADDAVLRVNSAGILAKLGMPIVADSVITTLKSHCDTRQLYLTAVTSRVLTMPWDQAADFAAGVEKQVPLQELPAEHVVRLASEVQNPRDGAARWCSAVLLGYVAGSDDMTRTALHRALQDEPCRENLRTIGNVLSGNNPLTA
jgi:transcriptional regulator with XRE-family HTH domain